MKFLLKDFPVLIIALRQKKPQQTKKTQKKPHQKNPKPPTV